MNLTIVVCTYNRANLLKSCLESLCGQSAVKSDYEVIIINNNSTDKTHQIAEDFATREPNFRVVFEAAQGLSHARNRGYMEARGEYVAYIDDDAIADKKWVENIILFTKRHPEVFAFGGPYRCFAIAKFPEWLKESYYSLNLGNEERAIGPDEWLSGTNMIYKRTLLMELGFDIVFGMAGNVLSYGEETNLQIRIKEKGIPIFYAPDIVVKHFTPDYKMRLWFIIKNYYGSGVMSFGVFRMQSRPFRQLLVTGYFFLRGFVVFIFSRERHLKTRIIDGFGPFFSNLGLMIGMVKR